MRPANLLLLMSDQHNRKAAGCYGHPLVRTPNLDRLAAQGTRFDAAYTPVPVCVPARACFATGKYNHRIGHWDNADPYDGALRSWHHLLRARGHAVVSIGKLHFRGPGHDYGFTESQIPMHVLGGKGDLMGLVRDELPVRGGAWKMAGMAGPGESSYTFYDRAIAARAQVWLREEAPKQAKPWVLFVSLVTPHYPLTAPPEHYYPYYTAPDLPWPKLYAPQERPDHPYLRDYSGAFNFDDFFDDDEKVRRALAGYFGLCSFMDEQVGKVLGALEASGLAGETRILYCSDHGDNLGARGLWGKSTMYEESAGVPLILAGPEVPEGAVCGTPASLLDACPFILESVGAADAVAELDGDGVSLVDLAEGARPDRAVLGEYHGMGSRAAAYMIRHGRWKYVRYVAYPPQLFDLEADPEELRDLASEPGCRPALAECEARLRAMLDPEAVDARAKQRQSELLAAHGGRAAVVARGDLGFSPPPEDMPEWG